MKQIFAAISLVLLGACSSSIPEPTQKFMGLLEVHFEGIGENGTATASARFVSPSSLKSGVQSRVATVLPINGTNAVNDVQFVKRQVSFLDDDTNAIRYVLSRFELTNRTATNINNLTLYAVNLPGTTLGGSGVANMVDATGVTITDIAKARAFKPTHGMRPLGRGAEVHSGAADLQFFTPLEVNNTTPGNLGVQQQAIALNLIPNTASVLEYGFSARNYSGGHIIGARDTATDCTVDACKGQITLAYKFPKLASRPTNPWAFTLYFVAADESVDSVSQSLEEQTANTLAGLSTTPFSLNQVRALAGSKLIVEDKLNPLCRVRAAVEPDIFLGPDPIPTSSGSLDVCFGATGRRSTDFIANNDLASALKIQTDGKILVAGQSWNNTTFNYDFSLVRYNANGSLDTSFGFIGKVITSIGFSDDYASTLVIQSDGKIVLTGYTWNGSNFDFALVRYNTNGDLDTSFNTSGIVTTDFNTNSDAAYGIGIQTDGKIVIAGDTFNGTSWDIGLARYTTTGVLDTTFDLDGKLSTSIGSSDDFARALAIQTDGKIVVAGSSANGVNASGNIADFTLLRYTTTGALDTSFDTDGIVTTPFGLGDDYADDLKIQTDGKIVLAGSSDNGSNFDFALARYNTNGALDTTFGTGGKVITDFNANLDQANALVIQSTGTIVVAGYSDNGSNYDFALSRYLVNGSLDTSFGTGGKVTTNFSLKLNTANGIPIQNALAIQSDGKIVMTGRSSNISNTTYDFGLARYNP
jgi:uncharacterized delta-60 repeat protein